MRRYFNSPLHILVNGDLIIEIRGHPSADLPLGDWFKESISGLGGLFPRLVLGGFPDVCDILSASCETPEACSFPRTANA